ncbi:MAG TPA: transaldolase [Gemmatimonadales bacterium]|nr:transaldolase [Gemmatimonadales bacterium]
MPVNPLVGLGRLGQSPWYDYITRDLLTTGELDRLIREDDLLGMTSNPTIFEKAVSGSDLYDDDIVQGVRAGKAPAEIFEALAVADVRGACDHFRETFDRLNNGDGTVSIEVSPGAAFDTEATVAEARRLWTSVGRPNAFIKIPGTEPGLAAITRCLAEGINVNITLLFSLQRYEQVIGAWLAGLEQRLDAGQPIDHLHSVASFFVSRVDTKIDPLLDKRGDPEHIRGTIAIANAALAYDLFQQTLASPRWKALAAQGAHVQRPLWASTSTKDPQFPDIYYVEALVAPQTVNTMPPETFAAYKDHGRPEVRIQQAMAEAPGRLAALARAGIDLAAVTDELEAEGVKKFAASYDSLLKGIEAKAGELAAR